VEDMNDIEQVCNE